jgi:hypothetical protein
MDTMCIIICWRRDSIKAQGLMKLPISSSKTPFYCLLSAVLEFHNLMENKDLLWEQSYQVTAFVMLCHASSFVHSDRLFYFARLGVAFLRASFPCMSVRMEQLGSRWTDFDYTWYLRLFRKSVEKIKILLKSDKDNGYFTWKRFDVFYDISLNSF